MGAGAAKPRLTLQARTGTLADAERPAAWLAMSHANVQPAQYTHVLERVFGPEHPRPTDVYWVRAPG